MPGPIFDTIFPHFLYLAIVDHIDPRRTSPFAGISPTIFEATWTFPFICSLPTSVMEPASSLETRHIRRITGAGYQGGPLSIDSLERQDVDSERPFCVLLTSNSRVLDRIRLWIERQIYKPLHISLVESSGAQRPDQVDIPLLQSFVLGTLDAIKDQEPSRRENVEEMRAIVADWKVTEPVKLARIRKKHNCTEINNACVESAGYKFESASQFTSERTSEFVAAILESCEPIDRLRDNTPTGEGIKVLSPVPEVIVFAPGMYRHLYERTYRIAPDLGEQASRVFRAFQQQKGYALEIPVKTVDEPLDAEEAVAFIQTRRSELVSQTAALSVRAAGNLCTTIRLPMGTNRALGSLRQLANTVRSSNLQSKKKIPKLFGTVQKELANRVPTPLLERIDRARFGIKLVSDIPLEWLAVGDLPLSIKHEVSRLPVTPGDLSIELLSYYRGIGLEPSAFQEILHIDAAEENDPIRVPMRIALDGFASTWQGRVAIRQERVASIDQFISAVNGFQGAFMIFDGHGSHDRASNIGMLHLGKEAVDVWQLRGRVNLPPIVLVSACDAHALDRSHATAANGFLVLGAQSVIAPMLPIDSRRAALFAARFIHRLVEFLPAALRSYGRSLRWTEVVTGMMRMQLITEVVFELAQLAAIPMSRLPMITLEVTELVNLPSRKENWYDALLRVLQRETECPIAKVRRLVRDAIALSDVVRYAHLGNPEHITIAPWSEIPALQGTGSEFWPVDERD